MSRHPNGGFAIVEAPASEGSTPAVRPYAAIGIDARRRQRHKGRQVAENPRSEAAGGAGC